MHIYEKFDKIIIIYFYNIFFRKFKKENIKFIKKNLH
jgi:hypothetical protein